MNRVELLQKKYPEQAEIALTIDDPSNGNNKYLLWIAKQLKKGHNVPDISASIKYFHENPQRFEEKDINKYKDLKVLEELIKSMGLSKRQEREKDKEGAQKIFENDDFLCIRVDDKPAMITYGSNTKWCTTMKDQTYYEDYVNRGNDFYILIVKNPAAARSTKYAIVRRGLLEFEVYDANDSHSRSFTEEEEDRLRIVVQSIVMDKPPKNYLRQVCSGIIPVDEAVEWLKNQTEVTRTYVEGKRLDLQYKLKSIDEMISIMSVEWERRNITNVSYDMIVQMAKKLSTRGDRKYNSLKVNLLEILKDDDKLIFATDPEPNIRALVVSGVSSEKAKEFFSDSTLAVFKSAARRVDAEYLLSYIDGLKSARRRKAANEIIIERISQVKVRAFVLNQPKDVLCQLME
jgi:hypothetical protein